MTARSQASRRPRAPSVPQNTGSSLPCPLISHGHMLWLPEGSRFPRAHGRGVARLHHPVAGHLSAVEVRTNHTLGFATIGPPRLHPHPTRWLNLSHKLCAPQRGSGLA